MYDFSLIAFSSCSNVSKTVYGWIDLYVRISIVCIAEWVRETKLLSKEKMSDSLS